MRFYHLGKQLNPSEIEMWMLEQLRLHVDYSKDIDVDWPPHIKKEFTKERLTERLEEVQDLLGLNDSSWFSDMFIIAIKFALYLSPFLVMFWMLK